MTLENSPEFDKLLLQVLQVNPMQKKRITAFLDSVESEYWDFAEELSSALNRSMLSSDTERFQAATAYKKMCADILRETIRFKKTGVFHNGELAQIVDEVYLQEQVMDYYITGLLLSYLFWPNHYRMFRFFSRELQKRSFGSYLEIGAGHGLFVAEAFKQHQESSFTVIDISEGSLQVAGKVLKSFDIDTDKIDFYKEDFLAMAQDKNKYDFITMGEILEHVTNPVDFLIKAGNLLTDGGALFMSTCINTPAIDHIYRFNNPCEIRDLLKEAGLKIKMELILPEENLPPERWEEELVAINYAAFCEKN